MDYTYLGRTGLKVSRLCLGTMNFGPRTEEKDAFRILDMALDAGINYVDTANIYGSLHGSHENNHTGWTEEILGRWFAQGGQRRERVILAQGLLQHEGSLRRPQRRRQLRLQDPAAR